MAQELYLGTIAPSLADSDDDFIMERCFEWFIFDYRLAGGGTVVSKFLGQSGLDEAEATMLKQWSLARLSLYEVESVAPGELQLKDILSQHRYLVKDNAAGQDIEEKSILFMRVLPVGREFEFSTSGLALPASCKSLLTRRIYDDIKKYWKSSGCRGKPDLDRYLRERAHVINAWVMELGLTVEIPQLIINEPGEHAGLTVAGDSLLENLPDGIIEKITDILLNNFYDQGVDRALPVLDGKSPREACRTVKGRRKVEKLVREFELMEQSRARKNEYNYDINKLRKILKLDAGRPAEDDDVVPQRSERPPVARGPHDYTWQRPEYAGVAGEIQACLRGLGYREAQIARALQLWYDYSSRVCPNFRKLGVWVAPVVYAMARLEFDNSVSQANLAEHYNVAVSSISSNYRAICRTLDLVAFDQRYSTQKSPLEGLEEADPVLAHILGRLRL
jgi:hypothetical protein